MNSRQPSLNQRDLPCPHRSCNLHHHHVEHSPALLAHHTYVTRVAAVRTISCFAVSDDLKEVILFDLSWQAMTKALSSAGSV